MHPRIFLFILSVLIVIPIANARIMITEIMANPFADEHLNEWIEIYNNDTKKVNLANWVIEDDNKKNKIMGGLYHGNGTVMPPFSYALITDSATRVYDNFDAGNVVRLYVKNLGLKNKGETIKLYDSSFKLIDKVSYNETGNGMSWALDEVWDEAEPTPGFSNLLRFGCDFEVKILLNGTIFFEDPGFRIVVSKIYGKNANVSLDRKIKDIYNKTIKRYDTLLLKDVSKRRTFSYKPKLNGMGVIMANISSDCDDNKENDFDSKILFKIFSKEVNLTNETCEIKDIEGKVVYESEDYKIKRYAIYFFSGLLLLVVVSLIRTQK